MLPRKKILAARQPALRWRSQGSAARLAHREAFSVVDACLTLAKLAVGGGVLGAAIGFLVLCAYGFKRNAFPVFSSDEWVPQLAMLGLFCGLVVGCLSVVPWLDAHAERRFVVVRSADAWTGRLAQIGAQVVIGWTLLICVPFVQEGGPRLSVLPVLWIGSVALASEVHLVWGGRRWPEKLGDRTELMILLCGGGFLNLVVLFVLWLLAYQRTLGVASHSAWWPAALATVCFAVYRGVFVAIDKAPTVARFYAAIVVVLGTGGFFSPEIARMTGLGNVPNATISVEGAVACELVDHLELTAPALADPCKSASVGAPGLVYLNVDIVSRFGGQVVLAAPGSLLLSDDGRCRTLMRKPRPLTPSFPCMEIPRDSVKAWLR